MQRYVHDQFGRPRGPLGQLAGRIMAQPLIQRRPQPVDRRPAEPRTRRTRPRTRLRTGSRHRSGPPGRPRRAGDRRSTTPRPCTPPPPDATVGPCSPGEAQLLIGDAQSPPDLGTFDAVFGCNVWLFWPDPTATLRRFTSMLASNRAPRHHPPAAHRHARPGGDAGRSRPHREPDAAGGAGRRRQSLPPPRAGTRRMRDRPTTPTGATNRDRPPHRLLLTLPRGRIHL